MFGRGRCVAGLVAIVVVGPACNSLEDFYVELDPIELGVDVRLEAATWDHYHERLYIVGSGGLVIDDLGNQWELPGTLRDVIDVAGETEYGGEVIRDPRLIVVGAGGFVATALHSGDDEIEFEFVLEDVGTDADLWAVTGARDPEFFGVIAGDDALIVGREDEQGELVWTQPEAPPGGWGQLRDLGSPGKLLGISARDDGVCALGLAGRMLCSTDNLETWAPVELDTDANLTSFCGGYSKYAVGEAGTLLSWEYDSGWTTLATKPAIDLIACMFTYPTHLMVVGADRTIYEIGNELELEPTHKLDWQPRATDPQFGITLVGDNGRAVRLEAGGLIPQ